MTNPPAHSTSFDYALEMLRRLRCLDTRAVLLGCPAQTQTTQPPAMSAVLQLFEPKGRPN
jgi:hypothetical protein